MTRRDELYRSAQEASASYVAAKERYANARRMVALGMAADITGAHFMEARAYSEWLRANESLQNYRG